MLDVAGLTKRLGGRRILDSIGFSCASAEVCVVLGENGAGKSTLLRVVCGMVEPDAGRVSINGHILTGGGVAARRQLGYVPDATDSVPDLVVSEFVHLVSALKGVSREHTLDRDLLAWRDRLGVASIWGQRFSSLSFGQRKRACVLCAMIGNPWLLVLDEPSNGLDPEGAALMIELICERQGEGKATLLASNDMPFVNALIAKRLVLRGGTLRRDAVEHHSESEANSS